MLRLLALYPLSLVVSVFATIANATTYEIKATYSGLPHPSPAHSRWIIRTQARLQT